MPDQKLTPDEESEMLLQAQEAYLYAPYWEKQCKYCKLPVMECDCPNFDSEGNEL